jgi:ribosome-associated toxin RatA of RatAB toxin-antitoxin module
MRSVERSAIVPYAPAAMYELVADVERYPEFLPWCEAARIVSRTDDEVIAGLTIGLGALRTTFTTANKLAGPQAMIMSLVDGPFGVLEGRWRFDALGDSGCKVSLDIEFEFSSTAQDLLFGRAFESACNDLIDAFTLRARSLYDERQSY